MDLIELKAYVATNRPESLSLASYIDGERAEDLASATVGGTLRLAEVQAEFAEIEGKVATFEHNTDALARDLGAKLLGK